MNSFFVLRVDAARRDRFLLTAVTYRWNAAVGVFDVVDSRHLGAEDASGEPRATLRPA